MLKHKTVNPPELIQEAVEKACWKNVKLEFDLKPVFKRGEVVGTRGHITNPANGRFVFVDSNQYSPYNLQIEYRYVHDAQDTFGGGLNRRGEDPERIAPEIVNMLCRYSKDRVQGELNFRKKIYA